MARLIHTFPALDPFGGNDEKTWPVGLEQTQLEELLKANHRKRLARLKIAAVVALDPIVIFGDWKRPEHEDGICYCGKHGEDYHAPDITVPAPPGMVFCVYVKPSGRLSRWNWEPADESNPDFPEGWTKDRFGRILWPQEQEI